MAESILTSVKKLLGVTEDYEAFDPDFLLYINGVFSTLFDLGIGPDDGYMIEDKSATWEEYLGDDKRLNNVKNYVVLRVRMLFDPPTSSFVSESMQKQITELEWRINIQRENRRIAEAEPEDGNFDPATEWVYDGGSP